MSFINVQQALVGLLEEHGEADSLEVTVNSRTLTAREAIGDPERKDYPLLQGKEVLVQAEIDGWRGQAFTSDPISYKGFVKDILDLPHDRPGNIALKVATLNALAAKMGKATQTIHCVDNQPEECSRQITDYIIEHHGLCRVGIIGFQPAILDHCSRRFGPENVFITDLSLDNIGQVKYGVKVWDGMRDTSRLVSCSDVVLVTGTVLANDTFADILTEVGDKPYYFYGTTCAALASINNVPRLCFKSK